MRSLIHFSGFRGSPPSGPMCLSASRSVCRSMWHVTLCTPKLDCDSPWTSFVQCPVCFWPLQCNLQMTFAKETDCFSPRNHKIRSGNEEFTPVDSMNLVIPKLKNVPKSWCGEILCEIRTANLLIFDEYAYRLPLAAYLTLYTDLNTPR